MRQRNRSSAWLMLLGLAAGCQDAPLTPTDSAADGMQAPRATRSAGSEAPYLCYVSRRTTEGPYLYRYGRMPLRFPASAIASDGATQRFQYRVESPTKAPLFTADCTIPATPKAVEVMYRLFFIDSRTQHGRNGGDQDMAVTQSCPASGCVLDPIVVIGQPSLGGGSTRGEDCMWNGECDTSSMQWYENEGTYTPESTCNPDVDPNCEQPLTANDASTIQSALNKHYRSEWEYTDDVARKECQEMLGKFQNLMAADSVFRGATNTQAGAPNIEPHYGLYNGKTGHIHFDPEWLDKAAAGDQNAIRELANTALHEAAHALKHEHGALVPSPFGPLYTEEYFKRLNPGANSCIKW